ncbi:hypothetical protein ACVWWO_005307 [Bradyrhizobium sp. F1.13.1]
MSACSSPSAFTLRFSSTVPSMKFFDRPSMYSSPGIQGEDCAEVCQGIFIVSACAEESDRNRMAIMERKCRLFIGASDSFGRKIFSTEAISNIP